MTPAISCAVLVSSRRLYAADRRHASTASRAAWANASTESADTDTASATRVASVLSTADTTRASAIAASATTALVSVAVGAAGKSLTIVSATSCSRYTSATTDGVSPDATARHALNRRTKSEADKDDTGGDWVGSSTRSSRLTVCCKWTTLCRRAAAAASASGAAGGASASGAAGGASASGAAGGASASDALLSSTPPPSLNSGLTELTGGNLRGGPASDALLTSTPPPSLNGGLRELMGGNLAGCPASDSGCTALPLPRGAAANTVRGPSHTVAAERTHTQGRTQEMHNEALSPAHNGEKGSHRGVLQRHTLHCSHRLRELWAALCFGNLPLIQPPE